MPKWDDSVVEFMTYSERRVTRSLAASVGKSVRPLHPVPDNEIVTGNRSRNQVAEKPGKAVRDNCSKVSRVKRKRKVISDGFSGGTEEQGYTKEQEKALPRSMNSSYGCLATQITLKNERRFLSVDSSAMPKWDDSLVEFVANSERRVTRSLAASFVKSGGNSGLIASSKNEQALDESGLSTHMVRGKKKSRKQMVSVSPLFPLADDDVESHDDSRNQVAGKLGKAIRGFQSPVTPRLAMKNVRRIDNCSKASKVKRKRKDICDGFSGETEEPGCTKEKEKALPSLMSSSGCYSTLVTPKNERKLLSFDAFGMPKWDDSLVDFVANSERRVTRSLAASVGKSIGKSSLITASAENDKALDESGLFTHLVHGQEKSRKQRVAVPPLPPFPDDELVNGNDSRIQVSGRLDKAIRGCESPVTPGLGKKILQRADNRSKVSKVNKKIKEVSDGFSGGDEVQGWTDEQEKALQVAYFAAKPTPHFWKKVAKLVPGKSAQDCFNKVHSLNMTPLTHLRSRTKGKNLSPQCESFSGVFEDEPKGGNKKKTCSKNGRKSHNTLKTVRYLLKKHTHQNQNNEGDLFSVLEPTASQIIQATSTQSDQQLSTPIRKMKKISSPGMRSSSSNKKKPLSRFRGGAGTAVVSPPVLKPIKNMALHEKYIDQLHAREAKRKGGRNKRPPPVLTQVGGQENVNTYAVLRAAKDCLVSDAMDAIAVFKKSQVNLSEEFSDDVEEVFVDEDDDEAEDGI